MKILTVIPIARGISKQTLTYFSKNDIALGNIIPIPLRNKTVHGLVTDSRSVTESKAEIKNLKFELRGAKNIEGKSFLSEEFLKAAVKISDFYATTVGAVLSELIPKAILQNPPKLEKTSVTKSFHEVLLLQSDDEERFATYRSLIREEFAKNRSVFILMPSTEDVMLAKELLDKGIESYTFSLHGGMKKKEIIEKWKKIISEPHPVVIIATGLFLGLPRYDIGTIVCEKESSRTYKTLARPFLDIRAAVIFLAKEINARLVFGDAMLQVGTIWREKEGEFAELAPLKFRALSPAATEIVNMKGAAVMIKKEFEIISYQIRDMLRTARGKSEHSFLLTGRKGLFPTTVCADCGTQVSCNNCGAPMILYGDNKAREFRCHHCGEKRSPKELCRHCGGWRLVPLGIGIENILEKVTELIPNAQLFILDKDRVKTHTAAVRLRNKFYETPGAILIGTEMALSYLKEKVENIGIISLDSYFSIPDWRINEKIFHILISLRAISSKRFILQTREERKLFSYAIAGNLIDFYRDEIEERKVMSFPPFSEYIKITLEGEKTKVKNEIEKIAKILEPHKLTIYDAIHPGSKSKHMVHGLISLSKENWPDEGLVRKLRALPPYVMVKVDPDTLL